MKVQDFQKAKDEGRKISMVICYDYSSAKAVAADRGVTKPTEHAGESGRGSRITITSEMNQLYEE